jgi:catechol 2,3-dioxygenase-like lactoylglutathione lyase family enzyme
LPDSSRAAIRAMVPLAYVSSVAASIEFYRKLGFEVLNSVEDAAGDSEWAYLQAGRAQLMIGKASEPVDPGQQAVLFYAYFEDTDTARATLVEAGIEAGPIGYPFWAPHGEFRITDPDGYVIMVTHV